MARCFRNVLNVIPLFWVELSSALFFEETGKSDDRIQRRSQFVAHTRQEFALEFVNPFHLTVANLQLVFNLCQLAMHAAQRLIRHTQFTSLLEYGALFFVFLPKQLYQEELPLPDTDGPSAQNILVAADR